MGCPQCQGVILCAFLLEAQLIHLLALAFTPQDDSTVAESLESDGFKEHFPMETPPVERHPFEAGSDSEGTPEVELVSLRMAQLHNLFTYKKPTSKQMPEDELKSRETDERVTYTSPEEKGSKDSKKSEYEKGNLNAKPQRYKDAEPLGGDAPSPAVTRLTGGITPEAEEPSHGEPGRGGVGGSDQPDDGGGEMPPAPQPPPDQPEDAPHSSSRGDSDRVDRGTSPLDEKTSPVSVQGGGKREPPSPHAESPLVERAPAPSPRAPTLELVIGRKEVHTRDASASSESRLTLYGAQEFVRGFEISIRSQSHISVTTTTKESGKETSQRVDVGLTTSAGTGRRSAFPVPTPPEEMGVERGDVEEEEEGSRGADEVTSTEGREYVVKHPDEDVVSIGGRESEIREKFETEVKEKKKETLGGGETVIFSGEKSIYHYETQEIGGYSPFESPTTESAAHITDTGIGMTRTDTATTDTDTVTSPVHRPPISDTAVDTEAELTDAGFSPIQTEVAVPGLDFFRDNITYSDAAISPVYAAGVTVALSPLQVETSEAGVLTDAIETRDAGISPVKLSLSESTSPISIEGPTAQTQIPERMDVASSPITKEMLEEKPKSIASIQSVITPFTSVQTASLSTFHIKTIPSSQEKSLIRDRPAHAQQIISSRPKEVEEIVERRRRDSGDVKTMVRMLEEGSLPRPPEDTPPEKVVDEIDFTAADIRLVRETGRIDSAPVTIASSIDSDKLKQEDKLKYIESDVAVQVEPKKKKSAVTSLSDSPSKAIITHTKNVGPKIKQLQRFFTQESESEKLIEKEPRSQKIIPPKDMTEEEREFSVASKIPPKAKEEEVSPMEDGKEEKQIDKRDAEISKLIQSMELTLEPPEKWSREKSSRMQKRVIVHEKKTKEFIHLEKERAKVQEDYITEVKKEEREIGLLKEKDDDMQKSVEKETKEGGPLEILPIEKYDERESEGVEIEKSLEFQRASRGITTDKLERKHFPKAEKTVDTTVRKEKYASETTPFIEINKENELALDATKEVIFEKRDILSPEEEKPKSVVELKKSYQQKIDEEEHLRQKRDIKTLYKHKETIYVKKDLPNITYKYEEKPKESKLGFTTEEIKKQYTEHEKEKSEKITTTQTEDSNYQLDDQTLPKIAIEQISKVTLEERKEKEKLTKEKITEIPPKIETGEHTHPAVSCAGEDVSKISDVSLVETLEKEGVVRESVVSEAVERRKVIEQVVEAEKVVEVSQEITETVEIISEAKVPVSPTEVTKEVGDDVVLKEGGEKSPKEAVSPVAEEELKPKKPPPISEREGESKSPSVEITEVDEAAPTVRATETKVVEGKEPSKDTARPDSIDGVTEVVEELIEELEKVKEEVKEPSPVSVERQDDFSPKEEVAAPKEDVVVPSETLEREVVEIEGVTEVVEELVEELEVAEERAKVSDVSLVETLEKEGVVRESVVSEAVEGRKVIEQVVEAEKVVEVSQEITETVEIISEAKVPVSPTEVTKEVSEAITESVEIITEVKDTKAPPISEREGEPKSPSVEITEVDEAAPTVRATETKVVEGKEPSKDTARPDSIDGVTEVVEELIEELEKVKEEVKEPSPVSVERQDDFSPKEEVAAPKEDVVVPSETLEREVVEVTEVVEELVEELEKVKEEVKEPSPVSTEFVSEEVVDEIVTKEVVVATPEEPGLPAPDEPAVETPKEELVIPEPPISEREGEPKSPSVEITEVDEAAPTVRATETKVFEEKEPSKDTARPAAIEGVTEVVEELVEELEKVKEEVKEPSPVSVERQDDFSPKEVVAAPKEDVVVPSETLEREVVEEGVVRESVVSEAVERRKVIEQVVEAEKVVEVSQEISETVDIISEAKVPVSPTEVTKEVGDDVVKDTKAQTEFVSEEVVDEIVTKEVVEATPEEPGLPAPDEPAVDTPKEELVIMEPPISEREGEPKSPSVEITEVDEAAPTVRATETKVFEEKEPSKDTARPAAIEGVTEVVEELVEELEKVKEEAKEPSPVSVEELEKVKEEVKEPSPVSPPISEREGEPKSPSVEITEVDEAAPTFRATETKVFEEKEPSKDTARPAAIEGVTEVVEELVEELEKVKEEVKEPSPVSVERQDDLSPEEEVAAPKEDVVVPSETLQRKVVETEFVSVEVVDEIVTKEVVEATPEEPGLPAPDEPAVETPKEELVIPEPPISEREGEPKSPSVEITEVDEAAPTFRATETKVFEEKEPSKDTARPAEIKGVTEVVEELVERLEKVKEEVAEERAKVSDVSLVETLEKEGVVQESVVSEAVERRKVIEKVVEAEKFVEVSQKITETVEIISEAKVPVSPSEVTKEVGDDVEEVAAPKEDVVVPSETLEREVVEVTLAREEELAQFPAEEVAEERAKVSDVSLAETLQKEGVVRESVVSEAVERREVIEQVVEAEKFVEVSQKITETVEIISEAKVPVSPTDVTKELEKVTEEVKEPSPVSVERQDDFSPEEEVAAPKEDVVEGVVRESVVSEAVERRKVIEQVVEAEKVVEVSQEISETVKIISEAKVPVSPTEVTKEVGDDVVMKEGGEKSPKEAVSPVAEEELKPKEPIPALSVDERESIEGVTEVVEELVEELEKVKEEVKEPSPVTVERQDDFSPEEEVAAPKEDVVRGGGGRDRNEGSRRGDA
ncbi:microtubule-associated protein futsch-like [Hetaerina americana]|uniref:microtubule-associated protein futsch-like n=1 Tax=Hetaerina americana TaxID=62018 RepID=UPI003A7F34DE